jgi:large subunit ribosomal protein L31
MKQGIHPQYYENAQVVCVCGNRFTTGSTVPEIRVELCDKCHPFYTGEQRFVDSASRIQKFKQKQDVAAKHIAQKKQKQDDKKQKDDSPKTLREMLMGAK